MKVITSLFKTVFNLIFGKLNFPKKYVDKMICVEDGLEFKIFRHLSLKINEKNDKETILIVRFRFKKFSHNGNIRASKIPIPLIAGFPGFREKIWMIDWKTGYWQGIYQWKDINAVEKYKKSFILGIMNKRSISESLSYKIIKNMNIENYIESLLVKNNK